MILTAQSAGWDQIAFFTPVQQGGRDRIACPCCGLLEIEFDAMRAFNDARQQAGVGFWITEGGGVRCPDFQEGLMRRGLTTTPPERSAHCPKGGTGSTALDLSVRVGTGGPPSSARRFAIVRGLLAAGCTRIGATYKTFVHGDWETELPRRVMW